MDNAVQGPGLGQILVGGDRRFRAVEGAAGGAGHFVQGVVAEKLVEIHPVAGSGRIGLPQFISGNVVALHDLVDVSAGLGENHVRGPIELIDTVQLPIAVLVAQVERDARLGIAHLVDLV